ncbi:MAG: response regulator transcription factor [Bacteroidetes bacterium]|nr:response regulator transcription factor [Bacteroidota bacterium]
MNTNLRKPVGKNILYIGEKNREQQELSDHLELENYVVHHVSKINDALTNIKKDKMEIVLMDTTRNEIACLELCHVIKSNTWSRKNLVIIASDKYDESSEVAAFRAGADDYITKPLKPSALIERLKTRLNEPKDSITIHPEFNTNTSMHIDRSSYTVYSDNTELKLSRKEFELLYLLASHPGKIFRREEVFEKVWKKKFEETNRTVDVHILRLRKKIGDEYIQTQKGVGYRFTK